VNDNIHYLAWEAWACNLWVIVTNPIGDCGVSHKPVSGQSINFEKQFRNHKSVYRYFQRAGFTPTVAGRLSGRTERQAGYDGWGNRENIQGMMGTNP